MGLPPDGRHAEPDRAGAAAVARLSERPPGLRYDGGEVLLGGALLPAVLHPTGRHR